MGAIPVILEQHADNASFLWLLRDQAIHAPHYTLTDLVQLDYRIDANLDGLRLSGPDAWAICGTVLTRADGGEVFTETVLALADNDEVKAHGILQETAPFPDLFRGLVSALGWFPYQQVVGHIQWLLANESPYLRRAAIAASAIHRQNPGRPLLTALADEDPLLRARALRAVGELGLVDLFPWLRQHLTAKDEQCRFWAAWAETLLRGGMEALGVLRSLAIVSGPYQDKALQIALRRMQVPAGRTWLRQVIQQADLVRLAVTGAAVLGDPEDVPWLIEQMTVPPLARLAGEAFTMITGIDLAYAGLRGDRPPGFQSGPTEDPEDDNVEIDPDEHLPWPQPEAVARWWEDHREQFCTGTRHLLGKPIAPPWLEHLLHFGYQRQRAAAAVEMALCQPGRPLFEVRAPGFRQQQVLAKGQR